jgi:hypothetical protein
VEKSRKMLKESAIAILILAAVSLVRSIVSAITNGFKVDLNNIPEGFTEDLVRVTMIIAFACSIVVLLVQLYIGFKGIKVANAPGSAKAPALLALILAVLAAVSVISEIGNIVKVFAVPTLLQIIISAVDVLIFGMFFVSAKQVNKAS